MRVHIGSIKERRGATITVDFEERLPAPWETEARLVDPVRVRALVTNSGACFTVRGEIKTAIELPCDRCLKEFVSPVELEFDEEFCPQGWNDPAEHLPSYDDEWEEAEDESANVFEGDSFDIDGIVQEYLVLARPPKVTCRDDCKGICPVCGVDRNESACSCEVDDIDPRMAGLAKMFERENRS